MTHTRGKCLVSTKITPAGRNIKLVSETDAVICLVKSARGRKEANAERLALCWNTHDDMLEALEGLLEVASLGPIGLAAKYGPDVDEPALWKNAGQNAADAIAKARGQQ